MACSINLNSDSTGCFYTGDIVTGNVILNLENRQSFKRIDLVVTGICKAQWSRASPTLPYIKIYSGKRKVLSITLTDIFREQFKGNKISAGVHQFPFHFALPEDLPSSFENSIGKVNYFIKFVGTPLMPTCKINKVVELNVLGNINLNHIEELLMPFSHTFHKIFRSSDKMTVNLKTYRAFAPKQNIPFEITIDNVKKVKINKIRIALMQKLHYSVPEGYADEEKKISKIEYNKFCRDVEEHFKVYMEIPQTIPTSLHTIEPMIDVSYIFRIEIMFPFHLDVTEDIPVTVTTAPVIHYEF